MDCRRRGGGSGPRRRGGLGGHRFGPGIRTQTLWITGTPDPDGSPVSLDATLYVPAGASASHPAPAIVLAHGFGGSKSDEDADARFLAQHGYVALAYSARGFGASGGQIAVDSPEYEVRDASKIIDFLASRPDVLKDAPGDPRVGVTGPSYGGALSLLAAGYDHRIDAIVSDITWNCRRQFRVTKMSVNRWRHAVEVGGTGALASKGAAGMRCLLTQAQQEQLARALEAGPGAHGYGEDQRWTLARIRALIQVMFAVRDRSLSAVSDLMARIGFCWQVPTRRASERHEEVTGAWRV
ncbi:MAG: alpha/beta fold hydrolase, partial [Trebonia sp.]